MSLEEVVAADLVRAKKWTRAEVVQGADGTRLIQCWGNERRCIVRAVSTTHEWTFESLKADISTAKHMSGEGTDGLVVAIVSDTLDIVYYSISDLLHSQHTL
ncbi:hypothetical protein HDU78_002220 [Chytriomyces hyalinus]|nr:hypothetical protein HDU78_002220 [Chytriomyces hyalinus]KAJ3265922.1 hypothetical protein HDU77_003396 [Chytriomyces hyalinus]